MNSRPFKIAVSGTHSTGKSTFIASIRATLESRGMRVEPVHSDAVDAQSIGFPILAEHTFGSTAWLMARAIELEEEAALKADVVLIDRPVSDALGYLLAALRHTGRALKAGQYERLEAICDAWAGEYDLMFLTRLDPTIPLGPGRHQDAAFRSAAADAITEVVDRIFPHRYFLDKASLDEALALAVAAVEGAVSTPTKDDTAARYACELAGERRLGLGCIGLTGIYGQVSKERAIDTLHAALDEGLSLFDTAALYASGANEELVGSVLGQRRQVTIVTKFGLYANSDGALIRDSSPRTIRSSVEASLRRLRRERIDLLLQHRPDPSVPDDVVAETVAALVSEGKVAAFGLSGTEAARASSWSRNPRIHAVQNELSLANPLRSSEPEIMLSAGAVFMAFAPLGRGLLTRSSPGRDGDIRASMAAFTETVSGGGRIVDVVSALAARRETCNAAIALGWLLAKSPNIVAIPGCRSRTQVHETASSSELTLSEAELAELEEALANRWG